MMDTFQLAMVTSAVDNATRPIRAIRESLGDLNETAQSMIQLGERMSIAGALSQGAANQMRSGLDRVIQPAIQFESAMAEVNKFVDFANPAGLALMGRDIREMSTEIPIAAEGIAAIVAAAGRSNVPRAELLGFAEDAARMGVAFEMAAGDAGRTMANWRAGLGLTQDGVLELADASNYLAANMNAGAGDIANVIQRQGAVAASAGLSATQTAALSAALLSPGTQPEIAATAMRNLVSALTAGEAATGRQAAALAQLGYDAQAMAGWMQDDAEAAITAVFQSLAAQPADTRGSLASMVFGEQSMGAIMPLLTNMDNLTGAFELVGDSAAFAGSMGGEFAKQIGTTEAALSLFNNQKSHLATTLGELLLPAINDILPVVQRMVEQFTRFAEANPLLFRIALGAFAVLAGVLALVAPILTLAGAMLLMGGHGLRAYAMLSGGMTGILGGLWSLVARTYRFGHALFLISMRTAPQFIAATGRMAASLLASLVPSFTTAIAGAWAFTAALLAYPITWIVLAIAAAAALIYVFWEPIKDFFSGLWDWITAAFENSFIGRFIALITSFDPVSLISAIFSDLSEVVAGFSLFEAGANIVGTIADGITSAAGSAVESIADVVSRVRDYLPFSPAKVGPLSDLHQLRFVETVAESVRPEPLTRALSGAMAGAVAATSGVAASASVPVAMPALASMPIPVEAPLPRPGSGAGERPGAAPVAVTIAFDVTINAEGGDAGAETGRAVPHRRGGVQRRCARWGERRHPGAGGRADPRPAHPALGRLRG